MLTDRPMPFSPGSPFSPWSPGNPGTPLSPWQKYKGAVSGASAIANPGVMESCCTAWSLSIQTLPELIFPSCFAFSSFKDKKHNYVQGQWHAHVHYLFHLNSCMCCYTGYIQMYHYLFHDNSFDHRGICNALFSKHATKQASKYRQYVSVLNGVTYTSDSQPGGT